MIPSLEVNIYFEIIFGGLSVGVASSLFATWILDKHTKNINQKKRIAEINSIRDFIKNIYEKLKNKDYNGYQKPYQLRVKNIDYCNMLEVLKTFMQTRAKHLKDEEVFDFLSILIAGITEHKRRDKDLEIAKYIEIVYSQFEKLKWLNYKHPQ